MPIFFLLVGLALVISAIRGTQGQLLTYLKADFTGSPNLGVYILAAIVIGGIGYIPGLKTVSNALLILTVLAIVLANKGFFSNLQAAVAKV